MTDAVARPTPARPGGAGPAPTSGAGTVLVEARGLSLDYRLRRGPRDRRVLHAVDAVDFTVDAGEIFAIVGESGSGKSSIARILTGLETATAGQLLFAGEDITHLSRRRRRGLARSIQLVPQDPFESLDPKQDVGSTIEEALLVHRLGGSRDERHTAMLAMLEQVGLHPAPRFATRYPHELSGGQRQRVVVACALVTRPRLVIADESVSMLDVSMRAGILELLGSLRRDHGAAVLFITHDLSLAWSFADRVAVVYLGRIVEIGSPVDVIESPRHPYTEALVSVAPSLSTRERILLPSETPSPTSQIHGCRFGDRCPRRVALGAPRECTEREPVLDRHDGDDPAADPSRPRTVACHFPKEYR